MKKTITPLYLHRRKDLTKDDLLEIYHNLNQFIWDDRLGEMPQEYHASRADEYRISCAVMMEIEWLVSKREPRGLSPSGGSFTVKQLSYECPARLWRAEMGAGL